jgi:hypothetical protein
MEKDERNSNTESVVPVVASLLDTFELLYEHNKNKAVIRCITYVSTLFSILATLINTTYK